LGKTRILNKYQNNIISTISSLSIVIMYNLFFSQITTAHYFHTYNHQAQNIIIYMHMDSPIDLYECGTTPTRHFARVMLLDFHYIFFQRYITGFHYIICQMYVTGLSLHNNARHHALDSTWTHRIKFNKYYKYTLIT
jgi:hypothetical protein